MFSRLSPVLRGSTTHRGRPYAQAREDIAHEARHDQTEDRIPQVLQPAQAKGETPEPVSLVVKTTPFMYSIFLRGRASQRYSHLVVRARVVRHVLEDVRRTGVEAPVGEHLQPQLVRVDLGQRGESIGELRPARVRRM